MKTTHISKRMAGALMMAVFLAVLFMLLAAYGPSARAQASAANRIGHVAPAHETEHETETHHPEETQTPHPENTETEVEATETHHPEATRTHEGGPTETSEPEETRTAEPEETETQHPEATETHHPEATRTHEVDPTETNEPEETRTVDPEATQTHHPEATETSEPEETRTAEPEETQTQHPEATETHHPEGTHTPEATNTSEPMPSPIPTQLAPIVSGRPGNTTGTTGAPATIPGTGARTFAQTGNTVKGIFLQYWDSNGGLAQQGLPLSGVMQEKSDIDGKFYAVQYFERAVFEYHPEVAVNNNVLLSQLGRFRYEAIYPTGAPGQVINKTNARYFPETKHSIGGVFLTYWQQNGGLAQQGFPISDEFTEVSPLDGKPYTVQYFERAVFEYHPENKAPYNVLLSQLGTFRLRGK